MGFRKQLQEYEKNILLLNPEDDYGLILEVDLKYPNDEKLHDSQNDYPSYTTKIRNKVK